MSLSWNILAYHFHSRATTEALSNIFCCSEGKWEVLRTGNLVPREGIILADRLKHTQGQHEELPFVRILTHLSHLEAARYRGGIVRDGYTRNDDGRAVAIPVSLPPGKAVKVDAEVVRRRLSRGENCESEEGQLKPHVCEPRTRTSWISERMEEACSRRF